MHKRFISYIISKSFRWQTAIFDTLTKKSTYMSDLMFTSNDLKHW